MARQRNSRSKLTVLLDVGPALLLGVAPFVFLTGGGEFENNPKRAFLQWGIAALAILALARSRRQPRLTWSLMPLDLTVAIFYLTCWLSLARALNPALAVASLLHWGAAVILYFLLRCADDEQRTIRPVFLAAALASGGVCLIGIAQHYFGLQWIPQSQPPASTFSNRNMASQFVVLCLPLALGALVLGRRPGVRLAGASSLALAPVYLFLTRTRSAWLALGTLVVACALALPWLSSRLAARSARRTYFAAIGGVLVLTGAVVWLAPPTLGPQVVDLDSLTKGTTTIELRIIYWKNGWAMARDQLLEGVGAGNFKLHYPLYHRAAAVDWTFGDEFQLERLHNDHLQVLVELGLVGLVAWMSMFVVFFLMSWKTFRRQDGEIRQQAFFIALGVVAFIVVAGLSFPSERALPPILLFALFGLQASLHETQAGALTLHGRWATFVRGVYLTALVLYLAASGHVSRRLVLTDFHHARGVAQAAAGETNEAERSLVRAADLTLGEANVPLRLAQLFARRGEYEAAAVQVERALRMHPNKINALLNLGYCYLQLGQPERAERYFEQALAIWPDSVMAHSNLGLIRLGENEYQEAAAHYRVVLEIARDRRSYGSARRTEEATVVAHLQLGRIAVARRRRQDAVEHYEAALSLRPEMMQLRHALAELRAETGP